MNFELNLCDEESTRYGRACRLVIEAGTQSVRDYVIDNLNPPRTGGLPATLRALRELFDKLRRDSVITLDQFQVRTDHYLFGLKLRRIYLTYSPISHSGLLLCGTRCDLVQIFHISVVPYTQGYI